MAGGKGLELMLENAVQLEEWRAAVSAAVAFRPFLSLGAAFSEEVHHAVWERLRTSGGDAKLAAFYYGAATDARDGGDPFAPVFVAHLHASFCTALGTHPVDRVAARSFTSLLSLAARLPALRAVLCAFPLSDQLLPPPPRHGWGEAGTPRARSTLLVEKVDDVAKFCSGGEAARVLLQLLRYPAVSEGGRAELEWFDGVRAVGRLPRLTAEVAATLLSPDCSALARLFLQQATALADPSRAARVLAALPRKTVQETVLKPRPDGGSLATDILLHDNVTGSANFAAACDVIVDAGLVDDRFYSSFLRAALVHGELSKVQRFLERVVFSDGDEFCVVARMKRLAPLVPVTILALAKAVQSGWIEPGSSSTVAVLLELMLRFEHLGAKDDDSDLDTTVTLGNVDTLRKCLDPEFAAIFFHLVNL